MILLLYLVCRSLFTALAVSIWLLVFGCRLDTRYQIPDTKTVVLSIALGFLITTPLLTAGTGEISEPELVETPQGKRVAPSPTIPASEAAPAAKPSQQLEAVVIRGRDRSVLEAKKKEEQTSEVLRGLRGTGPKKHSPILPPAALLFAGDNSPDKNRRANFGLFYSDYSSLFAWGRGALASGIGEMNEYYQSADLSYSRQELHSNGELSPFYLHELGELKSAIWSRGGRGISQQLTYARRETRLLAPNQGSLAYNHYLGAFSLIWRGATPLSCSISSLRRSNSDDGVDSYRLNWRDILLVRQKYELVWQGEVRGDVTQVQRINRAQAPCRAELIFKSGREENLNLEAALGVAYVGNGTSLGNWQQQTTRATGRLQLDRRITRRGVLGLLLEDKMAAIDYAGLVFGRPPVLLSSGLPVERRLHGILSWKRTDRESWTGNLAISWHLSKDKVAWGAGIPRGSPVILLSVDRCLFSRQEAKLAHSGCRRIRPALSFYLQQQTESKTFSQINYLPAYGGNCTLAGDCGPFYYEFELSLVGTRYYALPNTAELTPYASMNMRFYYTRFNLIKPGLMVYNVNDSDGEYSNGYPLVGRQFFAGAEAVF